MAQYDQDMLSSLLLGRTSPALSMLSDPRRSSRRVEPSFMELLAAAPRQSAAQAFGVPPAPQALPPFSYPDYQTTATQSGPPPRIPFPARPGLIEPTPGTSSGGGGKLTASNIGLVLAGLLTGFGGGAPLLFQAAEGEKNRKARADELAQHLASQKELALLPYDRVNASQAAEDRWLRDFFGTLSAADQERFRQAGLDRQTQRDEGALDRGLRRDLFSGTSGDTMEQIAAEDRRAAQQQSGYDLKNKYDAFGNLVQRDVPYEEAARFTGIPNFGAVRAALPPNIAAALPGGRTLPPGQRVPEFIDPVRAAAVAALPPASRGLVGPGNPQLRGYAEATGDPIALPNLRQLERSGGNEGVLYQVLKDKLFYDPMDFLTQQPRGTYHARVRAERKARKTNPPRIPPQGPYVREPSAPFGSRSY